MSWLCAVCGKLVKGQWNGKRYEPVSHYWKGNDITEAYCGAKCSLMASKEET